MCQNSTKKHFNYYLRTQRQSKQREKYLFSYSGRHHSNINSASYAFDGISVKISDKITPNITQQNKNDQEN